MTGDPEAHPPADETDDVRDALARAAAAIRAADALLATAGAGMGVDSGLPDFRGPQGFWRAYPPYRALGLRFEQMANPAVFARDPHLGWGFYGHRLNLYRATVPHAGFGVLRRWAAAKPLGGFVFTSNVDGAFQRAGFADDRIVECHGSIHHLQCVRRCRADIWPADGVDVRVDEATMGAADPLPACPRCGGLTRPNVLMFGDDRWLEARTAAQEDRYAAWLRAVREKGGRLAVVECGAGTSVATVRRQSEMIAGRLGAALVRVNLRDPDGPPGTIGVPLGAKAALSELDVLLCTADGPRPEKE